MKTKLYNKISGCVTITFLLLASCFMASCSDWLDVRSELEEKESNQFNNLEGFETALVGCYMSLADQDAYGQRLTMTNIESLANYWHFQLSSTSSESGKNSNGEYYLLQHDYTQDLAKDNLQAIYGQLFNVIAQANVILKHIDEEGSNIAVPATRNVIQGEAYALRALCQMDILRLFGQMPNGQGSQIKLPYSTFTGLNDAYPAYLGFNEYVSQLKSDFEKAAALLKGNDPAYESAFRYIDNDDDYMEYRQFRLNYWAVRGLQARLALYLGEKNEAYTIAKEIINAQYNGSKMFDLTSTTDLAQQNYAIPSEALFMLSKSDLMNYIPSTLIGVTAADDTHTYSINSTYLLSSPQLTELYAGQVIASHNHYRIQWNKNVTSMFGEALVACNKYYYETGVSSKMTRHAVIPMLRMSEIYLIAIECTNDLAEANSLYKYYMRDRAVLLEEDAFTSLAEVPTVITDEYRREFVCEGQMFYCYKRQGLSNIRWFDGIADAKVYELPLPTTEYDPATLQK